MPMPKRSSKEELLHERLERILRRLSQSIELARLAVADIYAIQAEGKPLPQPEEACNVSP